MASLCQNEWKDDQFSLRNSQQTAHCKGVSSILKDDSRIYASVKSVIIGLDMAYHLWSAEPLSLVNQWRMIISQALTKLLLGHSYFHLMISIWICALLYVNHFFSASVLYIYFTLLCFKKTRAYSISWYCLTSIGIPNDEIRWSYHLHCGILTHWGQGKMDNSSKIFSSMMF